MQYFRTLPKTTVFDENNNIQVLTNLMTRAYLLPSLSKNVMLFYEYDLKEDNIPENMAYQYYNDVNRYWLLFYANNIMDPLWDWPLTSTKFLAYLTSKYGNEAANNSLTVLDYTRNTVHHYEKIITITTSETSDEQKQIIRITIDQTTYNTITTETKTGTLNTGEKVTQQIDKKAVSLYDYEYETNEDKRKINVLRSVYAADQESQFETLMNL